jgi:hypothetical protein
MKETRNIERELGEGVQKERTKKTKGEEKKKQGKSRRKKGRNAERRILLV